MASTTTVYSDSDRTLIPAVGIETLLAARDSRVAMYKLVRDEYKKSNELCGRFDGLMLPRVGIEIGMGRWSYATAADVSDDEIELETDRYFWQWLFAKSNIATVMDAATREKMNKQLSDGKTRAEIPPLTSDNIYSTFTGLFSNKQKFLEDAVEALYKRLNYDYSTNTPRLIGGKVILENACHHVSGGSMMLGNYGQSKTIFDLEMIVCQISRSKLPTHEFGMRAMKPIPVNEWRTVPGLPTPLLEVKVFRKQTVHVRFLDSAVVDEMNRIISKRYPSAIAS